ncbi:hypothetical protein [Streptosporangium sp. KLBMP 9127]|nr:hypothetical protein [Streptosporangium sp. KLBMP 9127]
MDFWGTVLVLFRRWYVAVPAFLLALGGVAAIYTSVPLTYVSRSVLVLTIPPSGGTLPLDKEAPNWPVNPLLNFNDGLSMSASIVIQALGTAETAAELGAPAGSETTYKVTNGSTNPELLMSGPFVFIEGEARTAEQARDIVTRVAAQAQKELTRRQRMVGAPVKTYIAITRLMPPTTPEAKRGSKLRAAAAAVGIGFIMSLGSAFAFESVVNGRRARRRGPSTAPPASLEPGTAAASLPTPAAAPTSPLPR